MDHLLSGDTLSKDSDTLSILSFAIVKVEERNRFKNLVFVTFVKSILSQFVVRLREGIST